MTDTNANAVAPALAAGRLPRDIADLVDQAADAVRKASEALSRATNVVIDNNAALAANPGLVNAADNIRGMLHAAANGIDRLYVAAVDVAGIEAAPTVERAAAVDAAARMDAVASADLGNGPTAEDDRATNPGDYGPAWPADVRKLAVQDGCVDHADVNHYDHKRAKNWVATVRRDRTAPGGLARQFWDKASGSWVKVPAAAALDAGDVVEFAGDYYTGAGRKSANREYFIVLAVDAVELVLAPCECPAA